MEKEVIVINEPEYLEARELSVGGRDIWLADDEIKALECILKDYNADPNNFKRSKK